MDDTADQRYFFQPTQTYHRQYEALRAVFVDGRLQKEVAESFSFEYGSLRQLIHAFRRFRVAGSESTESPFFETLMADASSSSKTSLRNQSSLIGRSWCSPVRSRCVSEPERRGSSCSSRCWLIWDSIRWSAKQAIQGRR